MFSVVFSSPQRPTEECARWRVLRSPGTMESLVRPFTNTRCYKGVSWDCVQSFQAGWSRALMMCQQPLCLLLALPPQRPPQCFPRRRAEVVRPGGEVRGTCHKPCHHLATSPTLPIWSNGFFRKPLCFVSKNLFIVKCIKGIRF